MYDDRLAYTWDSDHECRYGCSKDGGYCYSYYCITAAQCRAMGLQPYLRGEKHTCAKLTIGDESTFDQKWLETGVYKCTGSLFDVRDGTAKCIPRSACDGIVQPYFGSCLA